MSEALAREKEMRWMGRDQLLTGLPSDAQLLASVQTPPSCPNPEEELGKSWDLFGMPFSVATLTNLFSNYFPQLKTVQQ